MTRAQKAAIAAAVLLFAVFIVGVLYTSYQPRVPQAVSVEGVVIRQDVDPRARSPVPFVTITAASGGASEEVKSDSAGFFRVKLTPDVDSGVIALQFRGADYRPLNVTIPADSRVYVAQMQPISQEIRVEQPNAPEVPVTNVRVRYSLKTRTTASIGTLADTLQVFDVGGLPCRSDSPCSPDGKWKAEPGSASFDAGATNEFREARVTCIAGPCPFTTVKSQAAKDGQILKVSALSWFGTATFLVEAEVTHAMISDIIRQSYPFIFGDSMSFTLPVEGEGPSVEAEVAKADVVFPLGPDITLPWAQCAVRVDADKSKLYRCQLKPGYEFSNSR